MKVIVVANLVLLIFEVLTLRLAFKCLKVEENRRDLLIPFFYILLSSFQVLVCAIFQLSLGNTLLMFLFSIFETIFISRYLSKGVFRNLVPTSIISAIIAIAYTLSFLSNGRLIKYELCVVIEQLFLLTLCFAFIYRLIKNEPSSSIFSDSKFWIVSGIMIFCGTTIPLFIYEIIDRRYDFPYFHLLTNVMFLILCFFFIKAFKCNQLKVSR
jgi:hypothetical protein